MSTTEATRLTDPVRSRTVYATHQAFEDDLDGLSDLIDRLLAGDRDRGLTFADARDHLLRLGQYLDALQALGPPDRDALFAAYQA